MGASTVLNGLMCGTGEYTTGYVHGQPSNSDKSRGVVALSLFELRRMGKVGHLAMVGTAGKKFPQLREHLKTNLSLPYNNLNVDCDTFPADDVEKDAEAYIQAIATLKKGDFITIFTPDNTHYDIALLAVQKGVHVLLTKPPLKTLEDHYRLCRAATENGAFIMVEVHKRFDPIYVDAREKIRQLGDFGFFQSYMSQPKSQLATFSQWAGRASDISYYLNSHHIDFHCWAMEGLARPVAVTAMASTGVADSVPYGCPAGTEDTITLMVEWRNISSGTLGHAVYTASWSASAKAEVHSQQRFHYMGHKGEVKVDQAHRGYEVATDSEGYRHVNPLFMTYAKDHCGNWNGHGCYGFRSIEAFVDHCNLVNSGCNDITPAHLPSLASMDCTTAILEGGRLSLDNGGQKVNFFYATVGSQEIISLSLGA